MICLMQNLKQKNMEKKKKQVSDFLTVSIDDMEIKKKTKSGFLI